MPYGDSDNSNLFDNDGLLWGRDQDVNFTNPTKAQAAYRKAVDLSSSCGKCKYFREGGSCKVVQGFVEEDFTCNYFREVVALPDLSNVVSKFLNKK